MKEKTQTIGKVFLELRNALIEQHLGVGELLYISPSGGPYHRSCRAERCM